MTDRVQRVAVNATAEATFSLPSPKLLELRGAGPKKIYIRDFGTSDNHLPGFAIHKTDQYCTGGLHWKFEHHAYTALFITFKFLTDVTGVDCDQLYYSPVYGRNNRRQQLCVPATENRYQFYVSFSDHKKHDPQILVTPIGASDT
jgi:hypothetical protein